MPPVHSILFFGDVLPGHDAIACRRQLQALLKCPAETMDDVFSGRQVSLRKGLAANDALRYQQRLTALGLRVTIEPPLPQSIPAVALPEAPLTASPGPRPEVAPVDLINCPACGERQPRRTLCRACSIDMPRYTASQAQQRALDPEPGAASRPQGETDAGRPLAESGIFGLDFRGRFGRRNFLLSGLLTLGGSFALAVVALTLGIPGLLIGGLGLLVLAIYGTRSTVFRFHDLGLSGWWAPLTWIPYVGAGAALFLLVLPGQKGGNAWGEPARPASGLGLLGGMALTGALAFFAFGVIGNQMPTLAALPDMGGTGESGKAAFSAHYDAGRDQIVMYSLSTCGFCAEKRRQFDSMGVRYIEYMIDQDPTAEARLNDRLHRAGLGGGAIGTPIIEVNGTMLPNNPGLGEIGRHLSRATKG